MTETCRCGLPRCHWLAPSLPYECAKSSDLPYLRRLWIERAGLTAWSQDRPQP